MLDLLAALIEYDRAALADGAPGALTFCVQRCMIVQAALLCVMPHVSFRLRLSIMGHIIGLQLGIRPRDQSLGEQQFPH